MDDLSNAEIDALHDLQLAVEFVYRAYGNLLTFHHQVGHAMEQASDAEDRLRDAGHEEFADAIRDEALPAGAVGDMWTYEVVEDFQSGFLADVTSLEAGIRDALVDGRRHCLEGDVQRQWRERAGWDADDEA